MKRWIIGTTLFLALSGTALLFSQSTGGKKKSFAEWWKEKQKKGVEPQDVLQAINQLIQENQKLRAKLADRKTKLIPVGTILPYSGEVIPKGFKLCNGELLPIKDYEELYKVIGTGFGGDQKRGVFRLPDLRGVFLRGWCGNGALRDPDANTRMALYPGGNSGNALGSYQPDEIKRHSHEINPRSHTHKGRVNVHRFERITRGGAGNPTSTNYYRGGGTGENYWPNGDVIINPTTLSILPFGGKESRPKNVYVNFIIKY